MNRGFFLEDRAAHTRSRKQRSPAATPTVAGPNAVGAEFFQKTPGWDRNRDPIIFC
jgi:hypothetical protein